MTAQPKVDPNSLVERDQPEFTLITDDDEGNGEGLDAADVEQFLTMPIPPATPRRGRTLRESAGG